MQIVPSTGAGDPGHRAGVLGPQLRRHAGRRRAGAGELRAADRRDLRGLHGDRRQGLGRRVQRRPRRRTEHGDLPARRLDRRASARFRFGDPYGNYMEVLVEPDATARIEVRKCEDGALRRQRRQREGLDMELRRARMAHPEALPGGGAATRGLLDHRGADRRRHPADHRARPAAAVHPLDQRQRQRQRRHPGDQQQPDAGRGAAAAAVQQRRGWWSRPAPLVGDQGPPGRRATSTKIGDTDEGWWADPAGHGTVLWNRTTQVRQYCISDLDDGTLDTPTPSRAGPQPTFVQLKQVDGDRRTTRRRTSSATARGSP